MIVLFINKKESNTFKEIIRDIIITVPIAVFLFSFFKSLITWSKPELHEIINYLIIFEVGIILKIAFQIFKNHLESIVFNSDENKLIITQIKPLKTTTKTIFKLDQLEISEIKHFPFSSFAISNYFILKNTHAKIKISTAGHEKKEIDLHEIHKTILALKTKNNLEIHS